MDALLLIRAIYEIVAFATLPSAQCHPRPSDGPATRGDAGIDLRYMRNQSEEYRKSKHAG